MSLREDFFEDQEAGLPTYKSQSIFSVVWPKVLAYEKRTGESLDAGLTKDAYAALFCSMGLRHTMRLSNYKNAIRFYISYLVARGALPEEQLRVLRSVNADDVSKAEEEHGSGQLLYFKDIAMLKEAISETLDISACFDTDVYEDMVAALYLIWHGLTLEQITALKKTDISENGVLAGGEAMGAMQPFALERILRYRNSEGFFSMKHHLSFFNYKPSEYLFRSVKSEKLTCASISRKLSEFNAVAKGAYSFKYSVVHWSGIFSRVYELERTSIASGGEPVFNLKNKAFASKIFQENLDNNAQLYLARIRDYTLYKRLYYPDTLQS